MIQLGFAFLVSFLFVGERPKPPAPLASPADSLQTYRHTLTQLRRHYPTQDSLPDLTFFLFGMGNRQKLIYRNGRLINARTGNIEWQWDVERETIVPSEYTVQLQQRPEPGAVRSAQSVQIREDETGVWILQTGQRPHLIRGTRYPVRLPRFAQSPDGPVLRVLLQEVLVNVLDGKPLTNFMVYDQPIPEDVSPMMAVLRMTGNNSLINETNYVVPDPARHDLTAEKPRIGGVDYPLSWQRNAPGAHYPGLTVLEKTLVKQRLIPLQAGHAARLFLALSGRQ